MVCLTLLTDDVKPSVAVHPLIQVPNQLVGAPVNTDVTLQCHVEASPKAINYWTRESGNSVHLLDGELDLVIDFAYLSQEK